MLTLLLLLAASCAPLPAQATLAQDTPSARGSATSEDERLASLAAELRARGDAADTQALHELSAFGTRSALEALLALEQSFGSSLLRGERLRALADFEGRACCEQEAFRAIAEAATGEALPEVRATALELLGRSPTVGKHFLRRIVESGADESVRVAALEAHTGLASAEDRDFYRELWRPEPLSDEQQKERKRAEKARETARKRGQEVEEPFVLTRPPRLRKVAFGAVAASLDDEQLAQALADQDWPIRGLALLELERRGAAALSERAHAMLERLDENPENRALAAGVLARSEGAAAAERMLELAGRGDVPDSLRSALAERLAEIADARLQAKLERQLTRGKAREKLFALRATRASSDPEHGEHLIRLLSEREPEVAIAAARELALRGERRADEALAALVESSKLPELRLAAFQARAVLHEGVPGWAAELEQRLADPQLSIRNHALRALGATRDPRWLPALGAALDDPQWSTRLAALDGLVALRDAAAVPPILARMQSEDGRMLAECADALWRLTGQPFERSPGRWTQWWEHEGASFRPIEPAELAALEAARAERRLRETSRAKSRFFGVEIVSRRVLFVLDVSGSMNAPLASSPDPQKPESRLAAAKRELIGALNALEPQTWFEVLAFAGGVSRFAEQATAATPEALEKATSWVRRLGPQMTGTALWDALHAAFENPSIDTLLLLSDGLPEGGEKDDPQAIREDIASWNRDRKVTIHTIALGEELQILRWLAEDSGGSHVFVP